MNFARFLVIASFFFSAACYESHSRTGRVDVGGDTRVDSGVDAHFDTPPPPDTGFDAAPDGSIDTGSVTCTRDLDCSSRACVRDVRSPVSDLGSVELICGPRSSAGEPSGRCEQSADCPRGLCLVSDRCVAPCASDEDCGANEECRQVMVRGNAQALEQVSACVVTFAAAPSWTVSEQRVLLGPSDTPMVIERSGPDRVVLTQTFDIRPIAFLSLETASGEIISSPGALPSGPNPVTGFGRPQAIMIPMSRRVPFETSYIANFRPIGQTNALRRHLEGPRRGPRRLVLEFFTFPALVTVQGDRQIPQRFEQILARTVREIERTLVVEVAEIRIHPVVGQLAETLTVAPIAGVSHPNLIRARQLAIGIDEATIPILWMRDIEGVLGTAGGIPGPWGVTGTDTAGVGISADSCVQSEVTPNTLTHEIGHYLGLYHTFEFDGSRINPLTDTPECADNNNDGVIAPSECEDTNFMFWTAGNGSTDEQRDIVHSAMLTAYR